MKLLKVQILKVIEDVFFRNADQVPRNIRAGYRVLGARELGVGGGERLGRRGLAQQRRERAPLRAVEYLPTTKNVIATKNTTSAVFDR